MNFDVQIDEEFARDIIDSFDILPQIDMVGEECSELVLECSELSLQCAKLMKSVSKLKRNFDFSRYRWNDKIIVNDPKSVNKNAILSDHVSKIAEESADVIIMIAQMAYSLDIKEKIDGFILSKVERLKERVYNTGDGGSEH